jgi:hypothetical protein
MYKHILLIIKFQYDIKLYLKTFSGDCSTSIELAGPSQSNTPTTNKTVFSTLFLHSLFVSNSY